MTHLPVLQTIDRYRLRIVALTALICLAGSSCADDENGGQSDNIAYGENIVGNGERAFEIKDNQYLERGTYLMEDWCYVTHGSTLTTEAGTVIKGNKEAHTALIIEPGGKLIVQGTVDIPIVFTSEMPVGKRKPGNWGGLILCGYARNNENIMQIEGGPRTTHSDPNNADNSGILSYVRIEFTRYPFKKNQEISGITFGSVGNDTQIDHLQVSHTNDDAFEWSGGTVNAKYLVDYHCWDDDFDTDNGYSGTYKHLLGIRHPRIISITGSYAFECSNNGTNNPATPTTAATFEDVMIYDPASRDASFANRPDFINGGGLRPENKSMLGLFGSALYLGVNTSVTFRSYRINGYPPDIEGTPAVMGNVVFSGKEEINYPEWTKGWCNFSPQETEY